jgi:hypothetical protein
MNSQSEITIIEDENYYEISSMPFFGEIVLSFQSGGDEDFVKAQFKIKNNKLMVACAAYIDAKNESYAAYLAGAIDLSRWNTKTKKYESLMTSELEGQNQACLDELTEQYISFDQF